MGFRIKVLLTILSLSVEFGISTDITTQEVRDVNSTGCYYNKEENDIVCSGNTFNLSNLVAIIPVSISRDFNSLIIRNTSISSIDENTFPFKGYTFGHIRIYDAPNLSYIHPETFLTFEWRLQSFRAFGTSLPDYNDWKYVKSENITSPFKIHTIVIVLSRELNCPPPELISPCYCEPEVTSSLDDEYGNRLTCELRNNFTVENLKSMFQHLSENDTFFPKHFASIDIAGKEFHNLPKDLFASIGITSLTFYDIHNVSSIHPEVFGMMAKKTMQYFRIKVANFTHASKEEVTDTFTALSSLRNVRRINIREAGFPFIPSNAFNNEHLQENMWLLRIVDDSEHHVTGLKSIGSFAFAGAPNLRWLQLDANFITEIEDYAFAFNESKPDLLDINLSYNDDLDGNGFASKGLSGAKRPLRITCRSNCSLQYLPETVFRPFFEENSNSEILFDKFEILCDKKSAWLFEENLLRAFIKSMNGRDTRVLSCKSESSFDGLPHCLGFLETGLIQCGGVAGVNFNVREELKKLSHLNKETFTELHFSVKNVTELAAGAFADFELFSIKLNDMANLSYIHPDALGDSTRNALEEFEATGVNITRLPNFALFPNLTKITINGKPFIPDGTLNLSKPQESGDINN